VCHSDLVISTEYEDALTHKDEGRVQVFVVLPSIISVKLSRLSTVYGKEVGPGVVGSEGFKELLEGGMEAGGLDVSAQKLPVAAVKWIRPTTSGRSGRPPAPAAEVSFAWCPHRMAGSFGGGSGAGTKGAGA